MQTQKAKGFAALAIIAVTMLALASPSFAGTRATHTINGVQWRELTVAEQKLADARAVKLGRPEIPPARFDHFNANVNVWFVPYNEIFANCRSKRSNIEKPPLACTIHPVGGKCAIILPKPSPDMPIAVLMRHEMGHCNGWSRKHEN